MKEATPRPLFTSGMNRSNGNKKDRKYEFHGFKLFDQFKDVTYA
jgi:hypothetical protein